MLKQIACLSYGVLNDAVSMEAVCIPSVTECLMNVEQLVE
jgi:hypothetical protein